MVDSIKITALQDIGANIAYTTLVPVVNMSGTPTTQKSNLQNLGNLILNGAGGSYFPRAAQATLALSVANAAQPNITSVGTLTSLAVTGNITAGNINGGNIVVANFFYGDGGFLTNVAGGGSNYSNSNVANYLPTYTGNVGANWVIASYFMGNGHNLTYLPGANVQGQVSFAATANSVARANVTGLGNIATVNLDGNSANVLHGDGSWSADQTTYSNSNVANYLPNYTGIVGANTISSGPNSGSNLTISANGATFVFGQGGALYWPAPGGANWAIEPNIDDEFEFKSTSNIVISTDIANSNSHFTFDSNGIFTAPSNVNLLGSRLNVGPDAANAANLLNPTLVIANTGSQYIQAAIINNDPEGSSDWSADGAGGGDDEAWSDLGFTGHSFNDANFTITGPGDGYVFVQGYANGIGGHMVLATGDLGAENDIIFATGGFLANNEFARIDHANNLFHLTKANSGIQFSDGTIQTTAAGSGSYGDSNVSTFLASYGSNTISTTGNVTVGNIIGNGQALTGLNGANVSGIVPHANVTEYVNVQVANSNITSYSVALVDWIAGNHRIEAELNTLKFNANTHTLTTINVNANVITANYLSVNNSVVSNLIPFSNVTQDLGNNTNRWKDIWLSNSTIHMGDATISANGNSIVVDSITVTDGNVGTIGNVASLNLDGSNSNVLYGNGVFAPASGGGGNVSELVNGDNSFVLDNDGNVVFEGNVAGEGVNRGLVWDFGANANGVNSELRQDMFGVTLRAWTEQGGGANGFSAPVRIVTNQDAAENVWLFDDLGNVTLPGNINAINDGGQLGAQVLLQPDLGKARLAARTLQYTQNFNSGSWTSASYTGTQVDIIGDPNLLNFVSNNTIFTSAVDRTFSINGGEPVPYTGYGASGNNVTLYTSITADPDPTVVTSIDFYYQSESYFGIDYDDGGLDMIAAGLTINIDNDQTQGPDINLRSGDDITLQAKNKSLGSESEGGDINIYAGDGASDDGQGNTASTGGDIQIEAGSGGDGNTGSGSAGGFTTLRAGTGGYAGATTTAGSGGYVEIRGGNGGGDGGNTALGAGGGYVSIAAGGSTQEGVNGAAVTINSGQAGPNALAGNVEISTPASANGPGGTWIFDGNGLLTLPDGAIIDTVGNNFEVRAVENVNFEANSVVNIYTDGSGNTYQWQFGDDGNLTLPGNTFAVNYANGTPVPIGGGGGGNTGNVTFDNVTVQGVNGLNLSAGSDFTANLAYLQVRAGDVASHIHLDTGNNQAYDLIVGDDQNYVQVSSTGNILLSAYDSNTSQYTWTLDYNGNLILAGGNSVIQSIANSSLDPLNPNVSTMALTPDANYSSQALVLDPTAPGHIHLRSPGANIDEPYANLFLGGENTSFEVGAFYGATPNAYVHSGGNTWTFASDGNLIFPRDANINTDPYLRINGGATPTIISEDTSLAGPANLAIVSDYLTLQGYSESITIRNNDGTFSGSPNLSLSLNAYDDGDSPTVQLINWNSNSGFPTTIVSSETDQVALTTNVSSPSPYSWTFDNAGNLTVPGPIKSANNLDLYAGDAVSIVSNNTGTTNTWTFDETGNLNTGNIIFDSAGRHYIFYGANNYINLNNDGGMDLSCNTEVKITTNYGDAPNRAYSYFYANGTFSAAGNITTSANVSGNVGLFNDLNLNNLGTNAFLYTDSNRNIYDTQFGYDSSTDTMSGGNISLTGNISANNLGNISVINLDSNASNILYGNGVFAAAPSGGGSNISNGNSNVNIATADGNVTIAAVGNSVVTITGTGANITGTANISGNANVGNLGVAAVVATANISTTGYFISGNQATGGFQLGNSNSRLKSGDSNSYMTMGQNPSIYPDTAASASAGVLIGGSGYILGNNGSRNITLNFGNASGVVGLQSNVQVGTGGSGTVLVPGTSVTGVNSLLAGPTFTPLANTMAGFVSNVNSYTQLTIQNKNTGADATVDFVATADNGSDTVNYLDMGIINSGYDNNTPTNSLGNIVFAADSYMYAQGNTSNASQSGGNLAIGTTVPGKNVKIFAGGVNNSAIVANIGNTGVAVTGNITVSGNIVGTSPNVTLVAGSYSTVFDNTGVATMPGNLAVTGNALVTGTSSNVTRRAFGLVATDAYVQLDDLKAKVTSSNQLSLILASGSWQGTGWTQTFTSGSAAVSSWVNLPLSTGYDFASGAMNSQGNGCKCVISDQTPNAKVYEITVVRSGTSGALWNISIERLV